MLKNKKKVFNSVRMLYLNVLTSLKPVSVPSVAILPRSNLNKSPSDENDIAKISNYIKSGLILSYIFYRY